MSSFVKKKSQKKIIGVCIFLAGPLSHTSFFWREVGQQNSVWTDYSALTSRTEWALPRGCGSETPTW